MFMHWEVFGLGVLTHVFSCSHAVCCGTLWNAVCNAMLYNLAVLGKLSPRNLQTHISKHSLPSAATTTSLSTKSNSGRMKTSLPADYKTQWA